MSEIIIRKASIKDVQFLVELDDLLIQSQKSFSWFYDLKKDYLIQVKKFIKNCLKSKKFVLIVAQDGTKIIGYGLLEIKGANPITKWGKEAVLFDIVVKKEYQNKGVGSKIFDAIEGIVKKQKIKLLKLDVLFGNDNAKEFYKSKNMESFKEVMIKKL